MLKGKLPSEVLNERLQYINAMKQFVEEQNQKLQEVLQQFGLTEESLKKVEPKQVCPYDLNHYVPEKSFKKHIEKCRLLKAGYQKDELPSQLANTDFCYEDKKSMKITLDESLLNKIIWDDCANKGEVYTGHRTLPCSHMEENINLTQSDRLAVYRYVVEKSHEAGAVPTVDQSDELLTTDWGSLVKKGLLDAHNNDQYASKLEQLAALRDMKRRRQSYRAKNVHITKKSYTEIIREVIVNQMQVLVPADVRTHIEDFGDSDKHKSRYEKDRKRPDRSRDDDKDRSYYRDKRRSRSRDRDRKRHRYHEKYGSNQKGEDDDKRDKDEDRSRRRNQISDLQLESKYDQTSDLDFVKKESTDNLESENKNDYAEIGGPIMPSPYRERSPGQRSKRSRSKSRSYSSSPSCTRSSDDDRHYHRHSHKKSKHKKKHSKKHSKKHKR